jgi:RNA-dependent RNA polymerase
MPSSYVIQSNRVIRRYPRHQDHFLQVDFREEEGLQYRWDREVDGNNSRNSTSVMR